MIAAARCDARDGALFFRMGGMRSCAPDALQTTGMLLVLVRHFG